MIGSFSNGRSASNFFSRSFSASRSRAAWHRARSSGRIGRATARFDDVIVLGGPAMICILCRIEVIRLLDVKAMRVSGKQLGEARMQEREAQADQ
nr:hypothetical protein [Xanthomonas fragariae]